MCVSFWVFGSYMASWRPEFASGNTFADGWLEPCLQKSGFGDGRTVDVIQTRPWPSSIGLCTLFLLVQIGSSPQYGDGCGIAGGVGGVFGSRTVSGMRLAVWVFGSSTGR